MLDIFITLLTFVLILITLFMMLVILMQRPNTNAGMGAAFGGGVTESTFGAETTNILTRATKWSAGAFFLVAVLLYVLYLVGEQPVVEEDTGFPRSRSKKQGRPATGMPPPRPSRKRLPPPWKPPRI
jgi:preprotein translocase subunit SecG